jgi:hypothetical protein
VELEIPGHTLPAIAASMLGPEQAAKAFVETEINNKNKSERNIFFIG